MKIISWNVNDIRAVAKKNFFQSFEEMNPDILCLQETKAQDDQVAETLASLRMFGYQIYSNSATKKGYSGTAILTKTEPISVTYDLGIEEMDHEGRVITAEYDNFYLVTVYTPNSQGFGARLPFRVNWDKAFLNHLKELEKKKPVITCGDFNVAHRDIDLKNPKANYDKNPGYFQQEIDGMDNYVASGFKDTYRELNPDTVKYSWWSYRAAARERNVGWRIDYFLASEKIFPQIIDAFILNDIFGSDHCPVGIELS